MSYYNYKKDDKEEFFQIILQHLKRILEISSHELRSSERILIVDTTKQVVETEDTRISFIQAIEMFDYSLLPYHDETMKTFHDKNIIALQGFHSEIIDSMPEELKSKIENADENKKEDMIIAYQVRVAKLLYVELIKLLQRQNFLTEADYSEGDAEFSPD